MKIYKYPLEIDDTILELPINSRVLTVQTQREHPMIWVMLDPNEKKTVKRTFRIYGTGHELDENIGKYIGTFQLPELGLVFHVFEVI